MKDTTTTKLPNKGGYLLQQWNMKSKDKNIAGKRQKYR